MPSIGGRTEGTQICAFTGFGAATVNCRRDFAGPPHDRQLTDNALLRAAIGAAAGDVRRGPPHIFRRHFCLFFRRPDAAARRAGQVRH
jgi:hypothetical protein